ncbi:MAG: P-loop NTPase [Candidatus Bathyarchaeia archaeon]
MKALRESNNSVDPRIGIIDKRLENVKRVIAISSGKGGVGKSLIATSLALSLVKKGFDVGLFDADFTSPSTHRILGVKKLEVEEDRGILPMQVHGLKYMSIIAFTGEKALPLRGAEVSNVLIELFSGVLWGKLDYLIIDMPPGIGDVTLDVVKLVKKIEFLVVCTPSVLAFETVVKLLTLLKELNVPVIGVIENMKMKRDFPIQEQVVKAGFSFLGAVPFDSEVENALGNVDMLFKTVFAQKLAEIVPRIISQDV